MRILLLLLGILIVLPAMGDVYRSVDEDGNVVFSDKPSPNAEKVEINEVQTIDPGSTPKFKYSPPHEPQGPAASYTNISITSPSNDEALSANDGNVSVSVSVEPHLFPGHIIVLYLDGSPAGESNGQFNLTNLDRGTHTLAAAVKNQQSGQEVIKSETITFTVHRHSIQHKPSTVGKPPPKKP